MNDLTFFVARKSLSLESVAALGPATFCEGADLALLIHGAAALDRARPGDVTLVGDDDDLALLVATRASACFVSARHRDSVPTRVAVLVTDSPDEAFRRAAAFLHPDSVAPVSTVERTGIDPSAIVHREARLEQGVTIDPGAVIGPRVEIGSGTTIGANATIGAGVRIGRDCAIDAQVSISHALIGDRVIILAGARIGQPAVPRDLHPAAPRLGRVIIQNDVAIGANAGVARGDMNDTVLGEGSRVQASAIIEAGRHVARNSLVPR